MPSRGEICPPDWSSRPVLYHSLIFFSISLATYILFNSHSFCSNSLRSFPQTFLDFHSLQPQTFPHTMELHHRSCVLPSNAPALPEADATIPSRVLQERSGNRRHGYADDSVPWKRSSSPIENLYSRQLGGSYFTGNIGAHLHGEKSETEINRETRRLLTLLQRCEKYQKYRDRQPQTQKDREQKWPQNLEEAFFRGVSLEFST